MKSSLAKFFSWLSGSTSAQSDDRGLKLITSRKRILKALRNALRTGNVVGIRCAGLGDGLLLVGVDSISEAHGDVLVLLKHYDLNGIHLLRYELAVDEVESVCEFATAYRNPVLQEQIS